MIETHPSSEDMHWQNVELTYNHYPSVRHRWHFILKIIKKWRHKSEIKVFDYGYGNGGLLLKIRDALNLDSSKLFGCDSSKKATKMAGRALDIGPSQLSSNPPNAFFDVIICSEVIEHTTQYNDILDWLAAHLSSQGLLILTTQSGKIHASDSYTGHIQHFKLSSLVSSLRDRGLKVTYARNWGFPFFTLQKYLTDFKFESIKESYLEGTFTLTKQIIFSLAYYVFFLNYLLPGGPQIFIVATRD